MVLCFLQLNVLFVVYITKHCGEREKFPTSLTLPMKRVAGSVVRQGRVRLHQRQLSQASLPPLQITTLPNKIRVATESTPGHFSSVGLYIDAGSRYELPSISGASHFLDRMAFKVFLVFVWRRLCLIPNLAVDTFSLRS